MQAGIDFTARCMAAEALANGGGGGTSDYTQLTNKPSINNVELTGNKTSANLGLQAEITGNVTISSDNVDDTGATNLFVTTSEKSTWNDKQDALTFDGIYNASTNKAATESTVYNEAANATLASGYTADSSETSITSATNINDAIEQLDYRTTTNKTNILLSANQTTQYNKMNIVASTTTMDGVTFTVNADKSITITGSQNNPNAHTKFILCNFTATSNLMLYAPESVTNKYFINTQDGVTSTNGHPEGIEITGSDIGTARDYQILVIAGTSNINVTFHPMIIPKDVFNAGFTDYQPYAMSNAEITAWILAHS